MQYKKIPKGGLEGEKMQRTQKHLPGTTQCNTGGKLQYECDAMQA